MQFVVVTEHKVLEHFLVNARSLAEAEERVIGLQPDVIPIASHREPFEISMTIEQIEEAVT